MVLLMQHVLACTRTTHQPGCPEQLCNQQTAELCILTRLCTYAHIDSSMHT